MLILQSAGLQLSCLKFCRIGVRHTLIVFVFELLRSHGSRKPSRNCGRAAGKVTALIIHHEYFFSACGLSFIPHLILYIWNELLRSLLLMWLHVYLIYHKRAKKGLEEEIVPTLREGSHLILQSPPQIRDVDAPSNVFKCVFKYTVLHIFNLLAEIWKGFEALAGKLAERSDIVPFDSPPMGSC